MVVDELILEGIEKDIYTEETWNALRIDEFHESGKTYGAKPCGRKDPSSYVEFLVQDCVVSLKRGEGIQNFSAQTYWRNI